MGTVTGLTAEKMQEVAGKMISEAELQGSSLVLILANGEEIAVGSVRGEDGKDGGAGDAPLEWHDLDMLNGAIKPDPSEDLDNPQYAKASNGMVYLRGAIYGSGTVAILPQGYRPSGVISVPANFYKGSGTTGILVAKDGRIILANPAFLDTVRFDGGQSKGWPKIPLSAITNNTQSDGNPRYEWDQEIFLTRPAAGETLDDLVYVNPNIVLSGRQTAQDGLPSQSWGYNTYGDITLSVPSNPGYTPVKVGRSVMWLTPDMANPDAERSRSPNFPLHFGIHLVDGGNALWSLTGVQPGQTVRLLVDAHYIVYGSSHPDGV